MSRYPRSTREAFPCERFPAIEVYRASALSRWWRPFSWLCLWGLFAAIGLLLGFRG